MEKKEQVREFFGKHAAAYTISPGHRSGKDLDRLIELLGPTGTEELLDVATATGNTGLAIAPLVGRVTGLDLTPQMEAEFQAQAAARGVTNARFVLGDVEQMPFPEGTFDMATCRRAAHHFPNIPVAVAEMARVLRHGGRLGVVDITTPEEPQAAALFNQMEAARDSSHGRALSPSEWRAAAESAGLVVEHLAITDEDMPWQTWLFPVSPEGPDAAEARRLALAAPADAAAQVVRHEPDGSLTFLKHRVILVAVKPGAATGHGA
jgi:ubiquinone/menaquinone biosynthesis C-methylase UbiE